MVGQLPEDFRPIFDFVRFPIVTANTTMSQIQSFQTNINCGSCVRSVTPFLDEVKGVTIWRVDVDDPRKVLTVEGDATKADIVAMVREAGFDIDPLPTPAE